MSRLPVFSFGALAVATIAAFFVVQHLKVTTPLIAGAPRPDPAVINPSSGQPCGGVGHRSTTVSFYLLHRSDDVDVSVVDQSGAIVRTIAAGHHMRKGVRKPDGVFHWNGREDSGRLAPAGNYYFRVSLIHQGRTVVISSPSGPEPVRVLRGPPRPVVTSVEPHLTPTGLSRSVAIRYAGNEDRGTTVLLYRMDLPRDPALVKSFLTPWAGHRAVWDGLISNRPAPPGTYLVGLEVTDAACATGRFPPALPAPPGSTPHAGVTVRYLAAQPPLDPVGAGARATAYVDADRHAYRWSLLRVGASKAVASGTSKGVALRVPVPGPGAGLYELRLRSGTHQTAVPLVARATGTVRTPRALVVLPALSWQGTNPVDDDGDGLPDTLEAGMPIELQRPLAGGLPAGFADEAAVLADLDASHRPYDLTTDLGLEDGVGPSLSGHALVLLAGSERWLPSGLGSALRDYVQLGGHLVSLGVDSMMRSVSVRAGKVHPPSRPESVDPLGARHGPLITHNGDPIGVIRDELGLFTATSGALSGFSAYQPIRSVAPPAQTLSEAGTSEADPSIVGYDLASGTVLEVGLPGFGTTLARNRDARALLARAWSVLSR